MSAMKTVGRVLLASMFISGGASTFMNPDGRASKAASAGIPDAHRATILNGAAMVVGGLALATGIAPKLAAAVLVSTLIPTTFVGHSFWKESDPASRANQMVHFQKNLSMLGGLLIVLAGDNDDEE